MKSITEYINESIRLDEAKKVRVDDILKGLDKIEKWCSASNIKKLMSEYMSAGDAEEFDEKHWEVSEEVVERIADILGDFLKGAMGVITVDELSNLVTDELEDDSLIDDIDKEDKDGDWDVDACIDLFNTVSMKVCKEAWLI